MTTAKGKKSNEKILLESNAFDHKSLNDISVKNEDIITIESSVENENFFKNEKGLNTLQTTANKVNWDSGEMKINALNLVIRHEELSKANFSAKEIKVEGMLIILIY